jgi:hypothetical protein
LAGLLARDATAGSGIAGCAPTAADGLCPDAATAGEPLAEPYGAPIAGPTGNAPIPLSPSPTEFEPGGLVLSADGNDPDVSVEPVPLPEVERELLSGGDSTTRSVEAVGRMATATAPLLARPDTSKRYLALDCWAVTFLAQL